MRYECIVLSVNAVICIVVIVVTILFLTAVPKASPQFDVVVLVGPNDTHVWRQQLQYTRKNVKGCKHVFIIASPACMQDVKERGSPPNVTVVSEDVFPFSVKDVQNVFGRSGPNKRDFWYLQQLMKLYTGKCIPGISDRYLVIDCDTLFLKPTTFIDKQNKLLFSTTKYESHIPYYEHMQRVHPSLVHPRTSSAVVHHMMFDRVLLDKLFALVASRGPFWRVFLECVAPEHRDFSGASEYELFYCFLHVHHPGSFRVRNLKFENVSKLPESAGSNDYVSMHHHMQA